MVLYENGFMKLDFDPTTDILTVDLPPVDNILLPEIEMSFGLVIEYARNYDVKRLLFNAKETKVEVEETTFSPIVTNFIQGLQTTRVQKIARITSASYAKENMISNLFKENVMPIQFRIFTELHDALEWLIE
ncbi:hypothetical protein [Adhaeribacter aquaticus]|uniref:hypothetical protein n=1 Tax=Adhaeribacter aquaticus TaxID=299567 RepID=UPI000400A21A|nr:hypothetical protein [Adhaeribacter aquaticus]